MPNARRPAGPRAFHLLRVPLFRLLAINLAIGACAAVLLVGGLLWLNPGHLRELILADLLADRAPGIGLVLLLASFVITFGSAAMGSAIMAQGRKQDGGSGGGHHRSRLCPQLLARRAPPR